MRTGNTRHGMNVTALSMGLGALLVSVIRDSASFFLVGAFLFGLGCGLGRWEMDGR